MILLFWIFSFFIHQDQALDQSFFVKLAIAPSWLL
jgi:hypothetical protein